LQLSFKILFKSSTHKTQLLLEITHIGDDKIFDHVFVPKESVINLCKKKEHSHALNPVTGQDLQLL